MKYLIVGSGRVAKHFAHYFSLLDIPYSSWSRRSHSVNELKQSLAGISHILLLISDSVLEEFFKQHLKDCHCPVIHFSGALEISGMTSAHPLMSFSENLYSLETYQKIPFILTLDQTLSEILPGLPNPSVRIAPEQKAYYHALCVAGGNFTSLLWKNMALGFQRLGLPESTFHPYLKQITENILANPNTAATGPLVRKDLSTVVANQKALSDDPLQKIYRAFVDVYFPEAGASMGEL